MQRASIYVTPTSIDGYGARRDRIAVADIQKRHGAAERLTAAQARRDRRKAKRASATAVLFYPWPTGGVASDEPVGAYVQGPNDAGRYQVVVVGEPKGDFDFYAAAVSSWTGKKLLVFFGEPMLPPDNPTEEQAANFARGFLSIVLCPADDQ